MKKIVLALMLLGVVLAFLSGCSQEKEKSTTESTSYQSVEMKKIDEEIKSSKVEKKTVEDVDFSGEKNSENSKEIFELLEEFGESYANFSSINDRNEKLKELMTKKCAEENGIYFSSENKLSSKGEVVSVYKPVEKDNDYGILLKCEQNETEIKVLLLVNVEKDKIASMTYNTVKQEY